jgi:Na+/proline symporter
VLHPGLTEGESGALCDTAYPYLISAVLPPNARGLLVAAMVASLM